MAALLYKEHQQIAYTCAYWDWLRGKRAMIPTAAEWGLDDLDAWALRYQCDCEYMRLNGQTLACAS